MPRRAARRIRCRRTQMIANISALEAIFKSAASGKIEQ